MTDRYRCRFAPSPTGYLHVGSAHSALCNWLFARSNDAAFLLRIEDTDAERNRPELTDNILEMLRWLGLDWDGDPVHQSDRFDEYAAAADRLRAAGVAYWCDCTPELVQARNKEAREQGRGGKPGYDGFCRDRALEPGPGRALRFRVPDEGVTGWDDLIRGKVSFDNDDIEDFVVVRSNGNPTFFLANVVDDEAMEITHVIRGEDHVNGTPKYLLLRAALGFGDPPSFAHLPLLVNAQRKKLSKRRDDVSMATYKERGFLPEAMRNYLSLLGWGPPDGVEVRSIDEIVHLFRVEDVNPSPAFFDLKKLEHVNGEWIRMLDIGDFVERALEFLTGEREQAALRALGPCVQERVKVLNELPEYFDWVDGPANDPSSWDKAMKLPVAREALDGIIADYEVSPWERDELHARFMSLAARLETSASKVQGPIRVPITGRIKGLPLFELIEYLGRDETLARLRAGRARLA
ncbi:MAG TPA: glutamate--tRNA ligase [Acidimicrobiales bacterium]|nr:glutamate--tRNA ligase [Acidimicrobiales bacterium]